MAGKEDPALDLLKAFGEAATSIFYLVGDAADAARWAIFKSKQRAEEAALRRRLEAHLDTQTLHDDTTRLIQNAGFPTLEQYVASAYERFALETRKQGLAHLPTY